jgi:hypothetical protein
VRAELLKVAGVLDATYDPEQNWFVVRFEAVLVSLESILATVSATGTMLGKAYLPEVVPPSPDS